MKKGLTLRVSASLMLIMFTFFGGCKREEICKPKCHRNNEHAHHHHPGLSEDELDFVVTNQTGNPVYTAAFYYAKDPTANRWRWYKSPVYRLSHNNKVVVDIDTIPDIAERESVYGYLAVFKDEAKAISSIYELIKDKQRIDLGILNSLRGKMVIVKDYEYGFAGPKLDFSIDTLPAGSLDSPQELDFVLENKTGDDLWATTFVYQREGENHPVWKYEKTAVQWLPNGGTTYVDAPTVNSPKIAKSVRAWIGLFQKDEREIAEAMTYQLLPQYENLEIGKIKRLHGKKVVIEKEPYGLSLTRTRKPLRGFYEYRLVDLKS